MQVTVLGAGSWGTTVASIVARRHPTILWARRAETADEINSEHTNSVYLKGFGLPRQLRATADLGEAVSSADLLVVGVPTGGFRDVLVQAKADIRPWIPVVSLSKGFEAGTLLRMTEVIRQELPGHPAAALTGPNIAREIMGGQAAASVIATEDLAVAAAIQEVIGAGMFRLYLNHDVVGCEIAGALKNVIAIATGIGQGIGVGDNTRAAVMSRGLAELTRLGVAMGAEAATFAGLAGMGDLIATCMSPFSRNRTVGELLGQGRKLDDILAEMSMVAEGVKTASTVLELAARYDLAMPVCEEINMVVLGKIAPAQAYRGLTPAGHEAEPG
ncbi:MAG: NAD(P)H-dependent glycerol-3-phosphate dehydrogenase [Acidimicrobiales bacterium]